MGRKVSWALSVSLPFLLCGLGVVAADEKDISPASESPEAQAAKLPKPVFSAPPRLATTGAELAAVKAQSDFPQIREAATKAAEPHLGEGVTLPVGFASWIFYYACADDGSYLNAVSPEEHVCPKCQKRYTDERTVAAYRCKQHYELEQAAEKLGWAYAYTGEDKYALAVRRILLHLADAYEKYPVRQDRWGRFGALAPLGGRRYVQSLDEGVGVIRLAKAYDLTRNSPVWTEADKKHVEEDFFRATSVTLLAFNQGINNHQTWYNAGVMAIGSVLGDAQLIDAVLTMYGGYFYQLQHSLGDDGLWYEGTMAYQNYALQAMIEIVDAGRRLGLPLHEVPRFRKLLESSLDVTYPNGQYPVINDSDPSSFQNFRASYQWAWNVYREPRFAQALAYGNPELLKKLLGPDAVPATPLATRTIDLPDVGLVALRVGAGANQSCVFFDYGKHGGGHGHFDKLNVTLFAAGREWLLDTGRIDYTHKEYKTWVKHTVAHNTVVLDERSQRPTEGKLLWLKTGDGYAACAGDSGGAYYGASMQRYLLLTEKFLVDVIDVNAKTRRTIDWLAHTTVGPFQPVQKLPAPVSAKLGDRDGYAHLSAAQRWAASGATQWEIVAGQGEAAQRIKLWLPAAADEQLITATGIGNQVTQPAPCLLRRRESNQARFATVYDLSGTGKFVTGVENLAGAEPAVLVTTSAGKSTIVFGAEGVKLSH